MLFGFHQNSIAVQLCKGGPLLVSEALAQITHRAVGRIITAILTLLVEMHSKGLVHCALQFQIPCVLIQQLR